MKTFTAFAVVARGAFASRLYRGISSGTRAKASGRPAARAVIYSDGKAA
jgi:hypothetical protein